MRHIVCKTCGEEKPASDFARGRRICRPCKAIKDHVDYVTNLEKRRVSQAAYRESHREELRLKSQAYKAAHPAERKAYTRSYYRKNRDTILEKCRVYVATHKEQVYARTNAWNKAHPEIRAHTAIKYQFKHRVKHKYSKCDFTWQQWEDMKKRQEYKCAACGEVKSLEQDHIIPVTSGGQHTEDNIQGLCHRCNSRKRRKTIDYRNSLVAETNEGR